MARRLTVVALLAALVGLVGARAATPSGPTQVTLVGHGYGHGRGMGQYGALGYAVDDGWTYHQILDHFYGGTVAGTVPSSTIMTVDMTNRDGADTIVAQERGELSINGVFSCTAGTACAVRVTRTGPGTFEVFKGTTCAGGAGGWTVVAPSVQASSLAVVATAGATDTRQDMLALCETGGIRWLRGDIWAVDTGHSQATVNHVPLDSYVRGVVPRESPASWGTLGGGRGEQALMAQAVAARSYAMADHWSSYAKICDTTACQVYGGRAFQDQAGNFSDLEGTSAYAPSDAAVANTTGEVRVSGATVALTEFSASTGGYTAGGQFPAVVDVGDATASNPYHSWAVTIPASAITNAYGSSHGTFLSLNVTSRDGHGDLGGRVLGLTVHFSGSDVTTTGAQFAATMGLRSNWFAVSGPGAPVPTPPSPTPTPTGYHALTADGTVYGFAGAPTYGSFSGSAVSIGERSGGYWILATDGSVHSFGAAAGHGSLSGKALNAPPFQIAPTPSGNGYWIVAFDGGVFSFGDAAFYGSMGGRRLNQPIVGIWPTADGRGYWLVAADGGIFSFGDARYAGSLPGSHIAEHAVALARGTSTGYLVATSVGHVYGFGTPASGGPADRGSRSPTVALATVRG